MITYNKYVLGGNTNIHAAPDYTKEVIEIIFLAILTFLILKYKYFIHHVISLILFSIFSIGIDILLNSLVKNLTGITAIQVISDIVTILLQILNYCYQKYMMEYLYHSYWNMSFALGLFLFFGGLIEISVYLIIDKTSIINDFKEKEIGYVILFLFLQMIMSFLIYLFRILILNYLTPNHMLIAYDLVKIFIILNGKNEKKWYSIILFIFQFISLAFFLEIFEFNFCNLNKNTKRNINKRADGEGILGVIDRRSTATDIYIEINEYLLNEENNINPRNVE